MLDDCEKFPDVRFTFNERSSVQACAVVLSAYGGRLNYTKLLKLLYLADRKTLLDTGRTITGSTYVSMKAGPVLSEVYECISEAPDCDSFWDRHLRKESYDLALVQDPGDDALSDFNVNVLQSLAEQYRESDWRDMINVVHKLKEWKNPAPAKVAALPVSRIFAVEGAPTSEVEALAKHRKYFDGVDRLLGS